MTRRAIKMAVLVGGSLAAGALLVAASGVLPFGAANARFSPIDFMGRFATRQSISLRAMSTTQPPLEDRSLVVRGAGHYEIVCRNCHGQPGQGPPVPLQQMWPRPPDLLHVAGRYTPTELFQIVKHGIRFSGMPGWATQQRDDEVWAMVAFLRALPSIDPAEYTALAGAHMGTLATDAPEVVQRTCARCHGATGLGRGTAFPKLAGQNERYLYLSLRAYALGARHSGFMAPVAASITDDEMHAAAAYYSGLPGLTATHGSGAPAGTPGGDPHGLLPPQVPRCDSCHGQAAAEGGAYPRLGGQYPEYLELQLRLFGERHRGGTAYAHLMHPVADRLKEEHRRTAAEHFGGAPGR